MAGDSLQQSFRVRERGGCPQESSVLLVTGWPFLRGRPLSIFIWILKNRGMPKEVRILAWGPGSPLGSQQPHVRLPVCS